MYIGSSDCLSQRLECDKALITVKFDSKEKEKCKKTSRFSRPRFRKKTPCPMLAWLSVAAQLKPKSPAEEPQYATNTLRVLHRYVVLLVCGTLNVTLKRVRTSCLDKLCIAGLVLGSIIISLLFNDVLLLRLHLLHLRRVVCCLACSACCNIPLVKPILLNVLPENIIIEQIVLNDRLPKIF
jgi:hypothetical protein